MAKTRAQKEQAVTTYSNKLGRSKSVVFADFKGMTMGQLSDLRQKLQETDAEFTVTKNTLLKLGLKNADLPPLPQDVQKGPIATLFSYEDEIAPIKLLVKALKDTGVGKIKGGILDKQFLDDFAVNTLATLPGKQELRAQVVGTLAAPLSGMLNVLQGNLRNLVYALNQIKISKGGE